jgi:hypothetical protein
MSAWRLSIYLSKTKSIRSLPIMYVEFISSLARYFDTKGAKGGSVTRALRRTSDNVRFTAKSRHSVRRT